MPKSQRLQRLADAQERIRTLQRIELEFRSGALALAEAERANAMASICGLGTPALEYLVVRTGLPARTVRNVEAARSSMQRQAERLIEDTVTSQAIMRLLEEARRREDMARNARELADVLDGFLSRATDSVAQD